MGVKTIWDGRDLPPIGCEVLIETSLNRLEKYKVLNYKLINQGYYNPVLYKILIDLEQKTGKIVVNTTKSLDEVYPLDFIKEKPLMSGDPFRPAGRYG